MESNLKLDKFKYFLECYFNLSMDYKDIENLSIEYKKIENQDYISELLKEIDFAASKGEWILFQTYVRDYGMRNLSIEKTKGLVEILRKQLSR